MPQKRLRVVHILGTLNYGGLQLRVLNLIEELPLFSHIVVIQSEEKGPLYRQYASVSDIEQCVYQRGRTLDFFVRLRKLLQEKDPDVVLAHLFGNHTLVALAGFMSGVPATYGVSANDPTVNSRTFWKSMALAHAARPFSRGEIAVGEAMGRVLVSRLHLPSRRVTVIPNGCRVEEIAARAAAARKSAGQKSDGIARALMVANVIRNKDHPTAFKAVQLLRRQGRDVELQLAGTIFSERGQSRVASLPDELGITDLVQFLGARTDVPELMGASDVLVHASNSEGFSNVILEAMAAGVPVVATDIPPSRDALDGGRCGLLVPPRDASALAEAIRRILDDEPLRLRLVAAASERVRSHYHVKRMAADYSKLLLARS